MGTRTNERTGDFGSDECNSKFLLAPKQPDQYENSPTKTVLPYLPRSFSKQGAWNTVLKSRYPPRPFWIEPPSIRAHTYLILGFHTNKLDKENIYILKTHYILLLPSAFSRSSQDVDVHNTCILYREICVGWKIDVSSHRLVVDTIRTTD